MGENSAISWTDHTFNPWWGCNKVSPACGLPVKGHEDEPHGECYAMKWAERCGYSDAGSKFAIWGQEAPRRFFGPKHWDQLAQWDKVAQQAGEFHFVFCGSMCDVMEDREDLIPHRERLYQEIRLRKNLIILMLTKRPQNFKKLLPKEWVESGLPDNVWPMTTVESKEYLWRADEILKLKARHYGLSMEPLLGPVDLGHRLQGSRRITWVIPGGESGVGARPSHPDWFRSLRDQCKAAGGVAFHFKQWGAWVPEQPPIVRDWFVIDRDGNSFRQTTAWNGKTGSHSTTGEVYMYPAPKAAGRLLDGVEHLEVPA